MDEIYKNSDRYGHAHSSPPAYGIFSHWRNSTRMAWNFHISVVYSAPYHESGVAENAFQGQIFPIQNLPDNDKCSALGDYGDIARQWNNDVKAHYNLSENKIMIFHCECCHRLHIFSSSDNNINSSISPIVISF